MSDRLDSDFLFVGTTGAWVGAIVGAMAGVIPYVVLLLFTMAVAALAWIPRSLTMTEIALQGGLVFGALIGTIGGVIPWGVGIHAAIIMVIMVWRQFGIGFGRLRSTNHLIVIPLFLFVSTGLFFNLTYSDFCITNNSDVCNNSANWVNGNPTNYHGCLTTCSFTPLSILGSSIFSNLFIGGTTASPTGGSVLPCNSATIQCFPSGVPPSSGTVSCISNSIPAGWWNKGCLLSSRACYLFYGATTCPASSPCNFQCTVMASGTAFVIGSSGTGNGQGGTQGTLSAGDIIGLFLDLFSSPQSTLTILTFVAGLLLVLIGLGVGVGANITLLGGFEFTIGEAATRMAQSLGVGLILFGLTYGTFGGFWSAFGPVSTFLGVLGVTAQLFLITPLFYGFYQQGRQTD